MSFINRFLKLEAAGGIALLASALLALILDNSPLAHYYDALCAFKLGVVFGPYNIAAPLAFWVSEGLMALFFMLIGIEVKKEIVAGELSQWSKALLPIGAAAGGIIVPALIYSVLNWGTPAMRGWAIPSATDIAFSLAVLSLLGKRVDPWLKLFLMTIAVIDDLASVGLIASVYTAHIFVVPFVIAVVAFLSLLALNTLRVQRVGYYIALGLLMWAGMLGSGVHATIAGVALGFVLPFRGVNGQPSLAARTVRVFDPWVTFLVLPIFAFVNSGIGFSGIITEHWINPIPMGIALGLFAGKQIGIAFLSWLLIICGLAKRPAHISGMEFYGVCILAGIGFTMSLFIGTLAFSNSGLQFYTRLGVMMGSLTSAVVGYAVLRMALKRKRA